MALIDISRKISAELFSRHPFLVKAAGSCIGWTSRLEGIMLGRSLHEADEATRGAFVTQEGYLIVYGMRKRFLQVEWSIAEAIPLHELHFNYQYLLDVPELQVNCNREAMLKINLKISLIAKEQELMTPQVLPGFTGQVVADGITFQVPSASIQICPQEDRPLAGVPAIVGRSVKCLHLKYWQDATYHSLALPDDCFLGDVQFNGLSFYLWRQVRTGVVAVCFGPMQDYVSRVLGKSAAVPLHDVAVSQLPISVQVRSVYNGQAFDDNCASLRTTNNRLSFIDSSRHICPLPPDTCFHLLRDRLIFVHAGTHTCGFISRPQLPAGDLQQKLSVALATPPESSREFFVFLSRAEEPEPERVELLEVDKLTYRTKVGLSNLSANAENIDRIAPSEFWIKSQDDVVWRAKLDSVDDTRFRQSFLQSRVNGRIAQSTGIAKLYEILIDLQSNRFMELLFNELFVLFEEMERNPGPKALIETLTNQSSLDSESRKALLSKIVLLAETLPDLKRSLERTGTLYPYQMRGGDDAWLKDVFGEEYAHHWERLNARSEVAQIRGFVRNTQSNLWRSLVETERSLARLEPVYSEKLKLARTKSFRRGLGTSAFTTTAGAVMAYATGQWYLPFANSLQLVNSFLSHYETSQQHDAILFDHGLDVLRWWCVFAETFAVQVLESQDYIRNYLDQLAKRDCELFKKVAPAEQTRFAQHLKSQLELRIQRESEGRFEVLGIGAMQLKQDLIEGLGRLAQHGNRLRLSAK